MKKRFRAKSLTTKYAVIFCGGMLLLAAGLVLLMLRFSSQQYVHYELLSAEQAMRRAANDIENQHDAMLDVAHQMLVTKAYKPGILAKDAYRDIELLQDFVRFGNFSPLMSRYFLMYRDSDKVYTSEGSVSYYRYYSGLTLGLDAQKSEEMYGLIQSSTSETVLNAADKCVLLIPIHFVNGSHGNAVLGVVLNGQSLSGRVALVSARDSDKVISIGINGHALTGEEAAGEGLVISVTSDTGAVSLSCAVELSSMGELYSALPAWLYIGIVAIMLFVAVTGMILGNKLIKPLRTMIRRFVSPENYLISEIDELSGMLERMEHENNDSLRLLRERMLVTILHGYYNERALERWGFLDLSFKSALYVTAAVICQPSQAEELVKSVRNIRVKNAVIYSAYAGVDDAAAMIICADSEDTVRSVLDEVYAMLPEGADLFTGSECLSPERISVSYMEALSNCQNPGMFTQDEVGAFVRRLIAFSEAGQPEAARSECDELLAKAESAPVYMSKRFSAIVSAEISGIAADRRIVLPDGDRLNSLVLLPDMKSCVNDVYEIVVSAFGRNRHEGGASAKQQSEKIIEYINEHAFEPDLSLSAIGACFRLSNDYISAITREQTGMAFKDYQTHIRMEEARRLLADEQSLTVGQIAERVGYRKTSNFIAKFKEVYGISPGQYR